MKKAELREEYLKKRQLLSDEECETLSSTVAARVFERIDFSTVGTVHLFLPIERFREIDTWQIVYRIWTQFPSVRVVVPKVDRPTGGMTGIELTKTTPLDLSGWGVPEPLTGPVIDPTDIDVVFVPLLCSDVLGYRVGYGKGFYDRFLAKCRPDCRKIGLNYFPPVDRIDDVTESDVRMDEVIDGRR